MVKSSKIDELLKKTNKQYKDEIIHYGMPQYEYERIQFTSPRVNYMTYGGIPKGKMVEFYGDQHSGKTTTALDLVANYQHEENARTVLYLDYENSLDAVWATKLGVDLENMIILKPTTQGAEDVLQIALDLMKTGDIGLVIIDSIGAMRSNTELEKDLDEATYAGIAKPMTRFSGECLGLCNKYDCTVIGINQERDDLRSTIPGKKKVPGGHGWQFNIVMRLEFRRGEFLDKEYKKLSRSAENPAGNIVYVSIIKSKVCPPNRRIGQYTLNYLTGIDYIYDLIDVCIDYDIIRQGGSYYELVDPTTGEILHAKIQGKAAVRQCLEEDEILLCKIEELLDTLMQ